MLYSLPIPFPLVNGWLNRSYCLTYRSYNVTIV
jgi:hypothetical protein